MHQVTKPGDENSSGDVRQIVAEATERARFKNARLRHLKERNELYLASRLDRDEIDGVTDEDEVTKEL